MALRNSTKGSIDLLHTKKQNEIIFQSVAKNAEKSAFFAFCGKFYLEGCVYFRFFCILRKTGSLESSLVWHFFAFLAFFRLTLLNSQLCVDGQTFSQIFV